MTMLTRQITSCFARIDGPKPELPTLGSEWHWIRLGGEAWYESKGRRRSDAFRVVDEGGTPADPVRWRSEQMQDVVPVILEL